MKNVILLGAGGHAKVVLEMLRLMQASVIGVCCPLLKSQNIQHWQGLTVLGDDSALNQYSPENVQLAVGIGMMPNSNLRMMSFCRGLQAGFDFINLAHPKAIVSPTVKLGQGVQIMAGAIIQVDCQLADNIIINSRAVVEHDCQIAAHSHIAPGAILCGQVVVGEHVLVGAGSTIIQGISVGHHALIGAGSLVIRDVDECMTVSGVPAKAHVQINGGVERDGKS